MIYVFLTWGGLLALFASVMGLIELIEGWRERDREQPVDWIDWIWLWRADDEERVA